MEERRLGKRLEEVEEEAHTQLASLQLPLVQGAHPRALVVAQLGLAR